jgi:hypothetical protein
MKEFTPLELIKDSYPTAARSISSLVELATVNRHLIEEIIALAMLIGINSAHKRIEWDRKYDFLKDGIMSKGPLWSSYDSE